MEEPKVCPYCGSKNFKWVGNAFSENNKTPYHCHECDCWFNEEIVIREDIRHKMSALLMDTDESNQMECKIQIEPSESCGLSTLHMPIIDHCYQMPCEGTLWFHVDGCVENEGYINFDDIDTHDLKTILEKLQTHN